MAYKISGTLSEDSRVIIVNESDWSVESNTQESSGSYEILSLASGTKTVIARANDGYSLGFGNVVPIDTYGPGDRGIFAGGFITPNRIEYVTISTLGNGTTFGELSYASASEGYNGAATSNGTSGRGVIAGGYSGPGGLNNIEYITISTLGDSSDFGDLLDGRDELASCSNGTNDRGIFAGGWDSGVNRVNDIEYITITSTGNGTDFGDLATSGGNAGLVGLSNGTSNRGVFGGGYEGSRVDRIQYITISSTGNTTDFGNLTQASYHLAGVSNSTNDRGVFAGGYGTSTQINIISYITISSTGNASDFGDLARAKDRVKGCSNGTSNRGLFAGGRYSGPPTRDNVIEYITITSLGNASDFGDTVDNGEYFAATSDA